MPLEFLSFETGEGFKDVCQNSSSCDQLSRMLASVLKVASALEVLSLSISDGGCGCTETSRSIDAF